MRRNNTIVLEDANEHITPWMNRGEWLDMLAGKYMTELYSVTSAQSREEESKSH